MTPNPSDGPLPSNGSATTAGPPATGRGPGTPAEQAAALVADRPPSQVQALALFALGRQLMVEGRYVEAEPALRRALAVAEMTDAHGVRATALGAMSLVLTSLGRVDDGIAAADEAVRIAEAHGTADDKNLVYVNATDTHLIAGRYDDVARLAVVGLEHARRFGMLAAGGALLTGYAANALFMLGRWDDALAIVAANRSVTDGVFGMDGAIVAARIALGRGRIDEAVGHAGRAIAVADEDTPL